jgi:putative heme-binding domain-containing protein
MPGVGSLPEIDIWRMVAFVRQLGRQGASDPITGDAAAGAVVYQSHGCAACHNIDSSAWGPTPTPAAGANQGGFMGPALTDVGAKRSPRYLRESIVDPNADIPLDYRSVAVVTSAGTRITGIHLNEDEYSIHLRDTSGTLRSFLKSELTEITLTGRSLMPASASLSKDDLDNLVAYLSSLRPKR